MWLQFKLAWRNIFRNKRRTFLAGIAIGIGMGALVFVDAIMIGMEENMIHSATGSFLGEGQIHGEGFRETQEVERTIHGMEEILGDLAEDPEVEHYSVRTLAFAMINSAAEVQAVSMIGIDPDLERPLSQIDEAIVEGAYLEGADGNEVLIGSKLADRLQVGIGGRVVLTVAEAETGDLSQEMFRVGGIYHFNIREMDRGIVFLPLGTSQRLLGLGARAHEIALTFENDGIARDKADPFWGRYSRRGNEAIGWTELMPELATALELSDFSKFITALILFGVVAFGIINTLFMSLYERMFEFGVLRALGTRPFAVGRLILFEAASLAVLSIGIGVVLGVGVTWIVSGSGIDYTGIEYAGVTFRERLYPVLEARQFVIYPAMVLVGTTLIGLYPAAHAARIRPAEAMRKSF